MFLRIIEVISPKGRDLIRTATYVVYRLHKSRAHKMIAKAQLRFVRGSARKIRLVIDLIRGRDVKDAFTILGVTNKRPSPIVAKLLKSAVSNAESKGLKQDDLYISKILADEAARWKRYRAAAFGRATEILKRTSHIKIELDLRTDFNKLKDPKIIKRRARGTKG